jgi:hypothetical protein
MKTRAHRGQHRKGKQNRIPKKKIEGNSDSVKLVIFKKYISKAFSS